MYSNSVSPGLYGADFTEDVKEYFNYNRLREKGPYVTDKK